MNKYYVTVLGKAWCPVANKLIDEEKNSVVYADSEEEVRADIGYQGEKILSIVKG